MSRICDNSTESQSLLDLVADGDRTAEEALFARHLPRIKAAIHRRLRRVLRRRFDASDVIQEVHSNARLEFSDYIRRRPMAFGLWLYRTAQHRLVDHERQHLWAARRSVRQESPLPAASSLATSCTPEDDVLRHERIQIVQRCLSELRNEDREIILRRIFDGLGNRELAERMHQSPEVTKKRFARALLRLKHTLRQAGL